MRGVGEGVRPYGLRQKGLRTLVAQEALVGTPVRVKEGNRRSAFCGIEGTVEAAWGDPTYPALDVRLEDGRTVLFWFHELDKL